MNPHDQNRQAGRKILRKVFTYPDPPEVVWKALTDSRALAEWLMPNTFQPEVGHRFIFKTDACMGLDGVTHCEVLELEPLKRMVWSWQLNWTGGKPQPPCMYVSWELEPLERGTRLIFEQSGLEGQSWLVRTSMSFGWGTLHKRWMPRVMARITQHDDGDVTFIPGAIVREKLCYKITSLRPEDGLTIAPTRAEKERIESELSSKAS